LEKSFDRDEPGDRATIRQSRRGTMLINVNQETHELEIGGDHDGEAENQEDDKQNSGFFNMARKEN